MEDTFERNIDYMRISITDRCNLRCQYCMPNTISLIKHDLILSYEEILRICYCASNIGIRKIKITGGEPLVRRDCMKIIRQIKELPLIDEVTITTNGVLLSGYLEELQELHIDGINISLDTLNKDTYRDITGRDEFNNVWKALNEAIDRNLRVKINCVPIKGVNDKDILSLVELVVNKLIDVRFIEMMPIGFGRDFKAVSQEDIIRQIREHYPNIQWTDKVKGNGPASYICDDSWKGKIGFISALSHKFCTNCNRIRLTSTGFLKPCLCFQNGVDLRTEIRGNADDEQISNLIKKAIYLKPREHMFEYKNNNREIKLMSQIGG